MLKVPPRKKLSKIFNKTVTLEKYAYTNGSDEYGQSAGTLVDTYTINAEIQEITSEDLAFLVPGTAEVGDAWGYFYPDYTVKGQTIKIAPEDIVKWNNKTWRIDKIEDYSLGNSIFYKRAFLKRVI